LNLFANLLAQAETRVSVSEQETTAVDEGRYPQVNWAGVRQGYV